MAIWTIARLTMREASRRKLLIVVVLLTVVAGLLSGWAFHRLMELPCGPDRHPHACSITNQRVIASTLVIMLMFMFSFVLAVGGAFLGAPAIANDVESGLVLSMLPRPIRRSDLVLGKWLGLAIILGLYTAVSCGLELLIVRWAMNYIAPDPLLSVAYIVAEALIVLTLAVSLSTRIPAMTGGIAILVFFGLTWMAGVAGMVGTLFNNSTIKNIGTVSSLILPTDGLWRAAIYHLEPAALIAVNEAVGKEAGGNPFLAFSPPTVPYLVWTLAWAVLVLGFGVWSFQRRDL